MKKHLLITAISILCVYCLRAQKNPKREVRGAWITTHLNLDWPTKTQTPAQQQTALLSILDQHKATGMNTMFLQVRSQSDALYPSTIEPWAAVLNSGNVQGFNPGWDPLLYAVTETHKRGMELHAWLNPFRAVANTDSLPRFSSTHVAKQHPEWMITSGKEMILNPGIPAVRTYILSVVTDIVQRYDIDGIHFDDYFYPNAAFNDDAAYNADPRGFPNTTAGRADWRRDNVNLLVQAVNNMINASKPWVKFGVAPTGIYRSSTNPAIGSNTSSGALQHYSALYADSKKWLQQGWVDYIAPEVYWYIGQPGSDYAILVPWWNDQANNGRHIYIGQSIYKVGATSTNQAEQTAWADRTQIPRQMRMNRSASYQNVYGEIGFRTAFLRSNPLNVRDSIRLNIYKRPALPPTMPWRDNTPPAAPSGLTAVKQANNSYILNWTKPAAASSEMDKVRQFVVYRSESPVININDTANLLFVTPTDVTTYTDNTTQANKTYYYVVTSVDRLYNESATSNVTDYAPPVIVCPGDTAEVLYNACSLELPDYRPMATVSDDATPSQDIVVTQSPAAGTLITGTGTRVITLTATDASGKTASCSFNVTMLDKEAPSLTVPSDITVSTDPGACNAVVTYDVNAADNCSAVNITPDHPSGSTFSKGTTTVTVTATDASGNTTTKSFNVTVNDTEAPQLTCAADINAHTDAGTCSATVSIDAPAVSDNCPGTTVSGVRSDGKSLNAVYPTGHTTITWTATDASGNTTSCTQHVTVTDNEAPSLTVPADITVSTDAGKCSAVVTYEANAMDNCSGVTVTSDYPSGSTFGKGTTTVSVTATDASGNATTKTFTVTVNDNETPLLTVPADITVSTDAGECRAVVTYDVNAADNCSAVTVNSDHPSGSTFSKGTTTVTVTATDASGNTTTKSFNVTVNDTQAPLLACAANINTNTDAGTCSATVTINPPAVSDNCPGATVSGVRSDGKALTAVYPKGKTTITWTAKDASGNTSSCTQHVTVVDKEAPVIANASASETVLWPVNHKMRNVTVNYSVSDNCGAASATLSVTSNEAPAGTVDWEIVNNHLVRLRAERDGSGSGRIYTITITATDNAGNTTTQDVTVAVPHDHSDIVASRPAAGNTTIDGKLAASAVSGPSNRFGIITQSNSAMPLSVKVTDVMGRVLEVVKTAPNEKILFSNDYRPGVYFVEVTQGDRRVVVKVVLP